jgi:D-tyrosyl-tRNA(Tyr) deacylase
VKVLVQRVSRAAVRVEGEEVGAIGQGMLVFLGVEQGDGTGDVDYMADKTAELRVFQDDAGRMNRSLLETGGAALVVSQFTLAGSTRRGRRPSFSKAADPDVAEPLYLRFVRRLRERGVPVETGLFQAMMQVELVNDGPVTLMLDPRDVPRSAR